MKAMQKRLKIVILDLRNGQTSHILPLLYTPGESLSSAIAKVSQPGGGKPTCFIDASENAIERLNQDNFSAVASFRFFHVAAVFGLPANCTSQTDLFAYLSQFPALLPGLRSFLTISSSVGFFETPYHLIRIERIPLSRKCETLIDAAKVIACESLPLVNRLRIVFHDHRSLKELLLDLGTSSSPAVQEMPKPFEVKNITLFKDIAASNDLLDNDRIIEAVQTEVGLHLVMENNIGKRVLKTFVKKEPAGKGEIAGYIDSGNRVLHMSLVEHVPDILLLLAMEKQNRSFRNFSWSRGIKESVSGKICDVFYQSHSRFYLLSWDAAANKAFLYRHEIGVEFQDTEICFSCPEQPIAFVWHKDVSSFILALPRGIFLYSTHESGGPLVDVSGCFDGYGRQQPGAGIHSMHLCKAGNLCFLLINRDGKIEIYSLLNQYEALAETEAGEGRASDGWKAAAAQEPKDEPGTGFHFM